jgi:hypothetical protein
MIGNQKPENGGRRSVVMAVRKSTGFLIGLLVGGLVMSGLLFIHPHLQRDEHESGLAQRKHLVRELQLTDLCLFTEARYTRHLSQADLHSPFQDYPMAFEHFPSGSLVLPPEHLLKK